MDVRAARTAGDALVAQTPPGARVLLADSGRYEGRADPGAGVAAPAGRRVAGAVRDISEDTGKAYAPKGSGAMRS